MSVPMLFARPEAIVNRAIKIITVQIALKNLRFN